MSCQKLALWKASVACVVPTSVPPKLKLAFDRIGDSCRRRTGMLLGRVKHLLSATVGSIVVFPGMVLITPVFGLKLTPIVCSFRITGTTWAVTLTFTPGPLRVGFAPTIEPA